VFESKKKYTDGERERREREREKERERVRGEGGDFKICNSISECTREVMPEQ
jgi:hypothetical protein